MAFTWRTRNSRGGDAPDPRFSIRRLQKRNRRPCRALSWGAAVPTKSAACGQIAAELTNHLRISLCLLIAADNDRQMTWKTFAGKRIAPSRRNIRQAIKVGDLRDRCMMNAKHFG